MTVKAAKRKNLEADGWKVGSAAEFLNLSDEEVAYIELKLELAKRLKAARIRCRLTQKELAMRIDSSQSRVAKMEVGSGASGPEIHECLRVRVQPALPPASRRDRIRRIPNRRWDIRCSLL